MNEVVIRGRIFSNEEVRNYGKQKLKKKQKTLLIIGISMLSMVLLYFIAIIFDTLTEEELSSIPGAILCSIIGIVLIVISFFVVRKDEYKAGVSFLEKHFPYPIGFDGNFTEVLKGGKVITLSKKPIGQFIVSLSDYKFQINQGMKYSKIYTGQDILDYEIKCDNEVIITSNVHSKKGVGRSIVGGLLFGGAGMVAGAITSNTRTTVNTTQKEVKHYMLALRMKDITKPSFLIKLDSLSIAEEVFSTLGVIFTNNLDFKKSLDNQEQKTDKFEELKKYKELLDSGVITQEEFDIEKKKILS